MINSIYFGDQGSKGAPGVVAPMRMLVLVLVLALAGLFWGPPQPAAQQAGEWVPRDIMLGGSPRQIKPVEWRGRPYVMVLSRKPGRQNGGENGWELMLARLEGGALTASIKWDLPRELRWVEPLRLGSGEEAWLALIGRGWYLGRVAGEELDWSLLCRCDTLFAAGKSMLPYKARFAVDLDGDGVSELLLPHWNGLAAYMIEEQEPSLRPLWRVHWEINEHYEMRDGRLKATAQLPRYLLRDTGGDGVKDFVVVGNEHLEIAPLPKPAPPAEGPYYAIEPEKLARLRRLELPESLLAALEKSKPASYSSEEKFLAALRQAAGVGGLGAEKEQLDRVLAVTRESVPVLFPRRLAIPTLSRPKGKESHRILSVEEMDGEEGLDLIHVKSNDRGTILDQKNQLRWFKGMRREGQLSFEEKPQIFFSEGPAFSRLLYPEVDEKGAPVLFMATTEVTLLAIIRAFTFNTVSLNLYLYPWKEGRLVTPPPVSGNLTFELKSKQKKNRPMLLLADLNGDGWREYIINLETDTLSAFTGTPEGPRWDTAPMAHIALPIPYKPDTIFVKDLDGDGREELIFWYERRENPPELLQTLRVLQYLPPTPAK